MSSSSQETKGFNRYIYSCLKSLPGNNLKYCRERDIVNGQKMSGSKTKEMLDTASTMGSRFTAPQMTRQFL